MPVYIPIFFGVVAVAVHFYVRRDILEWQRVVREAKKEKRDAPPMSKKLKVCMAIFMVCALLMGACYAYMAYTTPR